MIDLTIDRPVGAAADAKELEYIAALHQTCDALDGNFVDGSIDGALCLCANDFDEKKGRTEN